MNKRIPNVVLGRGHAKHVDYCSETTCLSHSASLYVVPSKGRPRKRFMNFSKDRKCEDCSGGRSLYVGGRLIDQSESEKPRRLTNDLARSQRRTRSEDILTLLKFMLKMLLFLIVV